MPSQIFDEGYGAYEVPDGVRLKFRGGEGADNVYQLKGSFEKAAQKGRRTTSAMGSRDRFNSVGSYARVAEPNPGPGTYSAGEGATKRPSSVYGSMGPKSPGKAERMKFKPAGEGADNYYNAHESKSTGSGTAKGGAKGFGQGERFGLGSYVAPQYDGGTPGPGTYTASAEATGTLRRKKVGRTPPPPRGGALDRLKFAAAPGNGDSPGAIYAAPSTFDKAAKATSSGLSASMGGSDRFASHGSYLSKDASTPGPGTYTDPRSTTPPRPRSAPPPPRRDGRVDFGARGEGTDLHYTLASAFDKAATPSKNPSASMGSSQRFGKVGSHYTHAAKEDIPGPGTYSSYNSTPARPSTAPRPHTARSRLDFGPRGEGAAPVYNLKSDFDKAGTPRKGPTSAMGSQNRFDGVGSYVPTKKEVPGPGNYDARVGYVKHTSRSSSFASPRMRPPGWRRPLDSSRSQHSFSSPASARRQYSFSSSP